MKKRNRKTDGQKKTKQKNKWLNKAKNKKQKINTE